VTTTRRKIMTKPLIFDQNNALSLSSGKGWSVEVRYKDDRFEVVLSVPGEDPHLLCWFPEVYRDYSKSFEEAKKKALEYYNLFRKVLQCEWATVVKDFGVYADSLGLPAEEVHKTGVERVMASEFKPRCTECGGEYWAEDLCYECHPQGKAESEEDAGDD